MSNLEQIKSKIRNMPMDDFVARVNRLARDTRYCTEDDIVCKIQDTLRADLKIVLFDPEYFGSDTAYIVIDDEIDNGFKELFIQGMLSGWDVCQDDYISSFID